ncbi:UvrD-helicase domain-containing protein [Pelagicoccus sp. SDUM812003]|uniref:UvrD-helicase domain-containing protein n=1 Tax=Pelagicoccus sp. SDUM812003 TaxID=3041267 RepID=UPI00280FD965|nr:UvrD-helicase domain-containing protein [Pelagicoccus sp. SDUM812003]MDQ8201847.1 UvrD-helicase domain-containing protein [Pelagicoccus sp. SDUM812003]
MIELSPGTTLIEASAGTGKTYTLCRIALQLTVQKGVTLDRILAVTFTEAATEELASRFHELYQTCLRELETGKLEEEILLELAACGDFDREQAIRALRFSLDVFDEAPISTIHSFCKRALDLISLETKSPLDAELVPVEKPLIDRLRSEYIRERVLESSLALSLALPSQRDFSEKLEEIGRWSSSHPSSKLHPTPPPVDIAGLDRRVEALPGAVQELLARADALGPSLKKNSRVAKQLVASDSSLSLIAKRGYLLPSDLAALKDLGSDTWSKALNKSGQGLEPPSAFALIDVINDQLQNAFSSLAFHYGSWLRQQLEEAKQRANIITFNDLLHSLHRALKSDEHGTVADLIGSRYDAVLIDEFQDTDIVQLEIAKTLFGDGKHYLFYIGDPKQSIYRFRGADIYAYFSGAQSDSGKKLTLAKNYRSDPKLIDAVNHLFTQARAGFVDERIVYTPVQAGKTDTSCPFRSTSPFHIEHLMLEGDPNKAPGRQEYAKALAERAAEDFSVRLNADPDLRANQVAFLVNSHKEADTLAIALNRRGISCSIRSERGVFKSEEAEIMKQLLASLSSPSRISLKKGLVATISLSVVVDKLVDESVQASLAPFFEYISEWSNNWENANFDVSFRRLLSLLPSFIATSNHGQWERRLANLHHLAEHLSETHSADRLSPLALLNWLERESQSESSDRDDSQVRLVSDQGKPQIITIHKSKGLQFPLVILPFIGLRRLRRDPRLESYHNEDGSLVLDMDIQSDENRLAAARRESLAEDIRLIYVALTRAEHENILYLCPEEISAHARVLSSSFAQFLLGDEDATSENLAAFLQTLAQRSEGALSYGQSPLFETETTVCDRSFDGSFASFKERLPVSIKQIPSPHRVLSFSAISKFAHRELESSYGLSQASESKNDEPNEETEDDLDDPVVPVEETNRGPSIFTLPKGVRAGDLLHLILERYDFSQPETLARVTESVFDELNFQPRSYDAIVATQIGIVTQTELPSPFGAFRLADIAPSQRLAELEFSYPVSGDILKSIGQALSGEDRGLIPETWAKRLSTIDMPLIASMLRGFIDLVFEREGRLYILDWKSNYLGDHPQSYDETAMREAMAEHDYFLQYLLYCVALKRYLSWKFPEDSFTDRFGGVYYLFVRGMSLGKQTGIYFDRPPHSLLDALDTALTMPDPQTLAK